MISAMMGMLVVAFAAATSASSDRDDDHQIFYLNFCATCQVTSGVVQAWVGQKLLKSYILRVFTSFLTDRSRICDATFSRCDRFQ